MADFRDPPPKLSATGSQDLITVLHTERRMKVYGVTENEIRTLTMINIAAVVLFSLGTGLLAFGIDLHKDILLTGKNLPEAALPLQDVVRPLAFIGAGIFYVLGIVSWFLRGGFLRTIKKETTT